MKSSGRRMEEIGPDEAMMLLGSVNMGRVVFTQHALPAIRPVNHLVDDAAIIIRSHMGAAIVTAVNGGGAVVAYEADDIDIHDHVGWSVIVTGKATIVRDPSRIWRYQRMMQPWVEREMDYVIEIMPELVTGFRLVPRAKPA